MIFKARPRNHTHYGRNYRMDFGSLLVDRGQFGTDNEDGRCSKVEEDEHKYLYY